MSWLRVRVSQPNVHRLFAHYQPDLLRLRCRISLTWSLPQLLRLTRAQGDAGPARPG